MDKKEFTREFIRTYGKKKYREYCKAKRVTSGFNTGTRTMKSSADYDRNAAKAELRREAEQYL